MSSTGAPPAGAVLPSEGGSTISTAEQPTRVAGSPGSGRSGSRSRSCGAWRRGTSGPGRRSRAGSGCRRTRSGRGSSRACAAGRSRAGRGRAPKRPRKRADAAQAVVAVVAARHAVQRDRDAAAGGLGRPLGGEGEARALRARARDRGRSRGGSRCARRTSPAPTTSRRRACDRTRSSTPSAVARATQVQTPGRGNERSSRLGCAWSRSSAATVTPGDRAVRLHGGVERAADVGQAARRVGARTPLNGAADGVARKLSGEPTTAGAARATTPKPAVVLGPDRQPDAPPALGPTDTVTA